MSSQCSPTISKVPDLDWTSPVQPAELTPLTTVELQAFADFLAAEMRHEVRLAEAHGILWYQGQIGADICSLAQAAEFRRRTVDLCVYVAERRRLGGLHAVERAPAHNPSGGRLRLVPRVPPQPLPGPKPVNRALVSALFVDPLRDLRTAVRDAPENRRRRAAFFAGLPREHTGIAEHETLEHRRRTFVLQTLLVLGAVLALACMLP